MPQESTAVGTRSHLCVQQGGGCGEDCLNRHSYIHCDPKLCPCGAACSNRPFHALRTPPMEVFVPYFGNP